MTTEHQYCHYYVYHHYILARLPSLDTHGLKHIFACDQGDIPLNKSVLMDTEGHSKWITCNNEYSVQMKNV